MTVLVDSDVLIEISRGRDEAILARWLQLAQSENTILYSPVTAAELWAGARPNEYDALTNLFRSLTCAPADGETGRMAGDFLRQYRKSHNVELADALIASAALLNHARLWTRNRKHYPMSALSFF